MWNITVEMYNDGLIKPFPALTRPGSYTLVYYDKSGDILCAKCATKQYELDTWNESDGCSVVGCDTYDEGPALFCDGDNCDILLESSYGDLDSEWEI